MTAAATALFTVLAGAATPQADGASRPDGGPVQALLGFLPTATTAAGGSVPVTLITGDRVEVGLGPDGVPVVRGIIEAARPDGGPVGFTTLQRGDAVYVVPNDALPLVGEVLDWELFNLAKLVDLVMYGAVDGVPVIVQRPAGARRLPATEMAGITSGRVLSSINGMSLTVDGDGQWWQELRAEADSAAAAVDEPDAAMAEVVAEAGIEKVWLNEVLHIELDESVPQIGAPVAWADGLDGTGVRVAVLDTGVDATHPDLAGKVVARLDFTGTSPLAVDGHGHGTHVAATIAGTGAASDGLRRGVAPGAELMIGKVCTDNGQCPADAIIAGMQWAASSGAKVVNMSLGGTPTDGTDPLSTSLNNLSQATGVLFVVAAGNRGPDVRTVTTPAAADEALAVAAVDKFDEMASFSSRGPRVGDDALKPDIAAPGVGIVAARAAGTSMGTPVDEFYTAASGTSMATPHVAGAAAIVAQLHPTLTGQEIKALLMNAAQDLGHDIFAQGAGRVDLARAVDPAIFASGQAAFGRQAYPHDELLTRTITYTNVSDADITLNLETSLTSQVTGGSAPDGMVTVSPTTLVVPAGGNAQATVTLDGSVLGDTGPFGPYRGEVRAVDDTGDLRAVSRISVFLEPPRFEVSVQVIPPDGASTVQRTAVVITPMDDQVLVHEDPLTLSPSAATAQLFPGVYSVHTELSWQDAEGRRHAAFPIAPQVEVSGPTTVTFDLREAVPVRFDSPDGAEAYDSMFGYRRTSETGFWSVIVSAEAGYRSPTTWWALPTDEVTVGSFGGAHTAVLVPPMVRMRLVGGGSPVMLTPRYADLAYSVPAGTQQWTVGNQQVGRPIQVPVPRFTPTTKPVTLVHAGLGTPADLDAVNVDGAVVLMTATDICAATCDFPALRERVNDAAARGAIGVLVASASGLTDVGLPPAPTVTCPGGPDSCPPVPSYADAPVASIHAEEAAELIDRLNRPGQRQFMITTADEVPPHLHLVADYFVGSLPEDMSTEVNPSQSRRVEHRIHADAPGEAQLEWFIGFPATAEGHELAAFGSPGVMRAPVLPTRTVVTTLVGGDAVEMAHFFRLYTTEYAAPSVLAPATRLVEHRETVLDKGGTLKVRWNSRPFVPGAVAPGTGAPAGNLLNKPCSGCRQDNTFYPFMFLTTGHGNRTHVISMVNNVTLLPELGTLPQWTFGLPSCELPQCDIHLFNEAGEEIPPVLLTTGFTLGNQSGKEANR
ncbi:MAG: S8 family serine peptidase [Micromonosporaceae bacterium]